MVRRLGAKCRSRDANPGCRPRRAGLRAAPFVPQARATAGPHAVFVGIRKTSHFPSRPCHVKSPPLAFFRGPSFSLLPQSPVFLSFFLIQMVEIPFYKTKSGPLSSLFSLTLTAISQHAFQSPPPPKKKMVSPTRPQIQPEKVKVSPKFDLHPPPSPPPALRPGP